MKRPLPQTRLALPSFLALVALALAAAPAQAAYVHQSVKSFALPGVTYGSGPSGVAINQSTGEVYVSAPYNGIVDALEASGAPDPVHPELTEANGTTPYPFLAPFGGALAVDNSGGPHEGDVYAVEQNGTVLQFGPSGARTAQAPISATDVPTEGALQAGKLPPVVNNGGFSANGLAVASNGDLYVADASNNVVDVFEPDGAFVFQLGRAHLSGPGQIALDPSNNVYVAEGPGVVELEQIKPEIGFTEGYKVSSMGAFGADGVAVDTEGNVFADEVPSYYGIFIAEFHASVGIENFGFGIIEDGANVAVNDTTGSVYVADFPAEEVRVFERTEAPKPPTIVAPTISATSSAALAPTKTALNAEINPGFGATVYRFQYGTTSSYGSSTPISESIGSDDTDHPVVSDISGLSPATTYHYRAVAINFAGTTHGPDETFTTPNLPEVSGASASAVTPNSVTLRAEVNPEFAATTYQFQYGTSATYGSSTPESSSVGADHVAHTVSTTISGLTPAQTYHFRIVATNSFGTTDGLDQTFTTAAATPSPIVSPKPCRKNYVKRHGKCIKKPHLKAKHLGRGGKR